MQVLRAAGFVAALAMVFVASAMLLPAPDVGDPQGNIRILARLDEYTRNSNPRIGNTLPTFLTQAGRLGVVPAQSSNGLEEQADRSQEPLTTEDITAISEVELQKGFCTATLPRLVRQQFPGSYDHIPDDQLEKTVLEKRPEYKDRVCVFPVWIAADPHNIVKYEVEAPGPLAVNLRKWAWAALITSAFGLLWLVVYRRLG